VSPPPAGLNGGDKNEGITALPNTINQFTNFFLPCILYPIFCFIPYLPQQYCFLIGNYHWLFLQLASFRKLSVFYPAMKKLNEKDLFPFFLFFDVWMFFYYLIFATTLIKTPGSKWK
jgi:hypothetical protein